MVMQAWAARQPINKDFNIKIQLPFLDLKFQVRDNLNQPAQYEAVEVN